MIVVAIAPLWSLRDSKGFRRRSIARRALWRRVAYRLTALPGLILAAALGLAVLVIGGVLLAIAWLIGAMTRRGDEEDEDDDDPT